MNANNPRNPVPCNNLSTGTCHPVIFVEINSRINTANCAINHAINTPAALNPIELPFIVLTKLFTVSP